MTMTTKIDFGEIFRRAWDMKYQDEFTYLGAHTVPGIEIRRLASAFAGSGRWKDLGENPTDDELFLLGLDIVRLRSQGTPFTICLGCYDKADIVELGRIANDAVHSPKHPVIKALFRRFRE